MAITKTLSNRFLYEKGIKNIDFLNDTFRIVAVGVGFTFDPDTHGTYSDISGEEITSAGGYVVGGEILITESIWTQDNINDQASISWNDHLYEASGEAMDDHVASCIIDDSHVDKVVVGAIEYGRTVSIAAGEDLPIMNIGVDSVDSS